MGSIALFVLSGLVVSLVGVIAFLLLGPVLPYTIVRPPTVGIGSQAFLRILAALADAQVYRGARVDVLANGESYYEAELAAIREARHSVNLEAYIFRRGEIGRRFVAALAERARAGVAVNLVLDAVGSFTTGRAFFEELSEAGGRVFWYHPLRWHTLPRINNRTHRVLLIIDGRVAFIGGAGFADVWRFDRDGRRRWRDTMFRVEGEVVRGLQATFVENWVESSGEILTAEPYFPEASAKGSVTALVVNSSPTTGLSTRARVLFQTLLASARKSIFITTPYFLPDRSARQEMLRAIRERGVKVTILTPGRHTDQLLTRRSSRRLYGPLLQAGAEIHEYQPGMIHTKCLVVDELWSVVGSTNFDNRSFGLNDEVNLAACDAELARRLIEDFAGDLSQSRPISHREWRRRPLLERAHELLGSLLERQQ
jgi:cardiolipin synthase